MVKDRISASQTVNRATTNGEITETSQAVTLPWIPGVSPSLIKVFRKARYKVVFKAHPNLASILTKKKKAKHQIAIQASTESPVEMASGIASDITSSDLTSNNEDTQRNPPISLK